MSNSERRQYCLNCNLPYPEGSNLDKEFFCGNCGQSTKESRLSFGRLIKDAISNVFNLDSRLIHTFRDIIYPSKLTQAYIEGKRKYYVNPARLFIFMLIGLITLALSIIKIENSAMGADQIYSKAERSKLLDEYSNMIDTLNIEGHEEIVNSIKSNLFKKARSLKTDTLGKNGPVLFNLGKPIESFGISSYDGVHLTQKELFEKYKVEGFWDKINVGQYIRVVTNPVGGIKYAIKNLTWAVFITVLLMSFFMKLLYIRSQYYLVEHVVLILNSHSLLFLVAALIIILLECLSLGDRAGVVTLIVSLFSFVSIIVIQYLTLKKYYQQGYFKTLLKQIMINSAYIFIFNMIVLMVAIISLMLY